MLDGLYPQEADAANVFAVGIERALGDRDGRGAQHIDLRRPGIDFGIQLLGRNDLVDQPHLVSLLRGVPAAQEPEFARAFLPDVACQQRRSPARVTASYLATDLSDH